MTESLAERTCAAQRFDFAETFRFQYLLSRDAEGPEGFETLALDRWHLHHCPDLAVAELTDASGRRVGALAGLAVDASGALVRPGHRLPVAAEDPGFADAARSFATGCGGRYVVVIDAPGLAAVFPDPAGAMGLVYDPEGRRVASSPLLALTRDIRPNPDYRPEALPLAARLPGIEAPTEGPPEDYKGIYGFGDTPDAVLRRVVPNHALSLDDFTESRFWPGPGALEALAGAPTEALAEQVAARLSQIGAGILGAGPAEIALSGGYDSRMVLACLAPHLEAAPEARLFSYANTFSSKLDAEVAGLLAARLGRPLERIVHPDGLRRSFLATRFHRRRRGYRFVLVTGGAARHPTTQASGLLDQLRPSATLVRGNMLELAGAVWWPPRDLPLTGDRAARHMLIRCQVAMNGRREEAHRRAKLDAWRAGLPDAARLVIHDFNYIENTLPNTQVGMMGHPHLFYLPPANDRSIFAACMAAPVGIRHDRSFYAAIMAASGAPYLAELPTIRELAARAEREGVQGHDALFERLRSQL